MRRILLNSLVLSLTIIIAVSLFETAVRLLFPQYDPSGHVTFIINKDGVTLSEKRGKFRQIKNTGDYNVLVRISELGLRESKPLKTSTSKDFFVVGDSFSFGWGVEEDERFSNQLESLLKQSKVFNISIPTDFDGYDNLVSYAKKNGAKIKKLIIGVTMENDIRMYGKSINNRAKKNKSVSNKISLSKLKYFLRDHSAAYFFTTSIIHRNEFLKKISIKMDLIVPNSAILSNRTFNKKVITSSVKRLKKISEKFNSLALIIPSRALWTGPKKERVIADKTHSFFMSEMKRLGIKFLDMKVILERSGNPMHFHFKHDGHWTAAAHQLAAKILMEEINLMSTKK